MKKTSCLGMILAVLSFVLAGLLTACQPAPPLASASKMPSQTQTPISAVPTESSAVPEPSMPTYSDTPQDGHANSPVGEPPLNEAALVIAVPDFLTVEQQDFYRRANSLYEHLLGSSIEFSETLGTDAFPPKEYETVQIGDMNYLISQGRYSNWADFDRVVRSVFTGEFWDSFNILSNGQSRFAEHNGKLCFLDTAKGIGYFYNKNFDDKFRLEEKTDSSIIFTLIGHYSLLDSPEGETVEQRENRRSKGYDYTIEFPIKMVFTENEWRFDEFYSALVDEREQS